LFPFCDLPSVFLSLPVGEPSGVVEPLSCPDCHEVKGISTSVRAVGRGVEWQAQGARFPWRLPRCRALLKHFNDLVCYVLSEVAFWAGGGFGRYVFAGLLGFWHGCHPLSSKPCSGISDSKPESSSSSPPRSSKASSWYRLVGLVDSHSDKNRAARGIFINP